MTIDAYVEVIGVFKIDVIVLMCLKKVGGQRPWNSGKEEYNIRYRRLYAQYTYTRTT
jgi:hypothetical protein